MKQEKIEHVAQSALFARPGLADKILFGIGLVLAIFVLYINYLVILRKGG